MIKYNFSPFTTNIIRKTIGNNIEPKTLFLFPTQNSKKDGLRSYQQRNELRQIHFQTIDEFKDQLFSSDKPILKEEKRTLLFYSSLTEDDKNYFNISDYFQSIALAHKFFKFWQEINEELVDLDNIGDLLQSEHVHSNWQMEQFDRLEKMKYSYENTISKKGFADEIFIRKLPNLNTYAFKWVRKIVVINQFYLTNLEKEILRSISDKEIILSYQIPQDCFDKEKIAATEKFSVESIKSAKTENISIIEVPDSFSQTIHLFSASKQNKIRHIIDFRFEDQPYAQFFSSKFFTSKQANSFQNTSIFKFFANLHNIINSLIIEKNGEKFLSLEQIFAAIPERNFIRLFLRKSSKIDPEIVREKLINFCQYLLRKDYHFVDMQSAFLKINEKESDAEIEVFFENIFRTIRSLLEIKNISNIIELVRKNHFFRIAEINSKFENEFTNIAETFFSALGDFQSIENCQIVHNWAKYFSPKKNQNKNIAISTGILKLLLEYLKPKKYDVFSENSKEKIQITSLHNTRNLEFDNIAILNVTEGVLPPTKKAQFLFSENQRKKLGLKSYDEIILREKYYFLSTIFRTKNVYLFTLKNLEKNLTASSFLEELKIDFPNQKIINRSYPAVRFGKISRNFFQTPKTSYPFDRKIIAEEKFYTFPFEKNIDLPKNTLQLSPTSWEKLSKNPFLFYLEYLLGFEPKKSEMDWDFSPQFIGSFTHGLFKTLWQKIKNEIRKNKKFDLNSHLKKLLKDISKNYIRFNQEFKFINPHNFSEKYFRKILISLLEESMEEFFLQLQKQINLADLSTIEIFSERSLSKLQRNTTLLIYENIRVEFEGQADLILADHSSKFIVDYKTGKHHKQKEKKHKIQLIFYEMIYYLLEKPEKISEVRSFIYYVMDELLKPASQKKDRVVQLKDEIRDALKKIHKKGFPISSSKDPYEPEEITRKDLYNQKSKGTTK